MRYVIETEWCVPHGSAVTGDTGFCEAVEGDLPPWNDPNYMKDCSVFDGLVVINPLDKAN